MQEKKICIQYTYICRTIIKCLKYVIRDIFKIQIIIIYMKLFWKGSDWGYDSYVSEQQFILGIEY